MLLCLLERILDINFDYLCTLFWYILGGGHQRRDTDSWDSYYYALVITKGSDFILAIFLMAHLFVDYLCICRMNHI